MPHESSYRKEEERKGEDMFYNRDGLQQEFVKGLRSSK